MDFINESYENIKCRVTALEKTKEVNSASIKDVEKKINDIKSRARPSTVELRSIPKANNETNEDLISTVTKIGKAVNLDISACNLRDIYCLPPVPGQPSTSRPVIADFNSVPLRNNLLTSVRKYNKDHRVDDKINTQVIGLAGPRRPIYVDEYLAPELKQLFYRSRQIAKQLNYSCWHANGKILLRKTQEEKPMEIKSDACLQKLKEKQ
ncbi:hypothetical protein O0L34_g19210 [Tuta absoluta]|nr:hypothetical protein O0L34_g19210 [Tuta absoluta]